MTRRAVVIVAALLLLAAPAAAAPSAALVADAGLGGLAKAGRWTAVRVAIDRVTSELSGELVVEWGDARVRRAVSLGPGPRRVFEIYVRTADVRDAIDVRLASEGQTLQSVSVPIRTVPFDERLIVCLQDAGGASSGETCSISLAPDAWPASWRGYDAADEVIVGTGGSTIAADRRGAIDTWRWIHALEDSASFSTPREPATTDAVRPRLRGGLLAYVLALFVIPFVVRRLDWRAAGSFGVAAVLIAGATAAAFAVGRAASTGNVTVRFVGAAHQLTGEKRALVTMRGLVEFPDAARFEVRGPFEDGAFDSGGTASAHDDWRYDEGGRPVLAGRFGLGERKAFQFEGVGDLEIVKTSSGSNGIGVSNVAPFALTECRFVSGFSEKPLGTLAPGSTIDLNGASGDEPLLKCAMPAAALSFTSAQRGISQEGALELVAHLPSERTRR